MLPVTCGAFRESAEDVEGNLQRLNRALVRAKQHPLLGIWRRHGRVFCAFPSSPPAIIRDPLMLLSTPQAVQRLVTCVRLLHDELVCVWPCDLTRSIVQVKGSQFRVAGAGIHQATCRVPFRPERDLHALLELCDRTNIKLDKRPSTVRELEQLLLSMGVNTEDRLDSKEEDDGLLLSWCHAITIGGVEEKFSTRLESAATLPYKALELMARLERGGDAGMNDAATETTLDLFTGREFEDATLIKKAKGKKPQAPRPKATKNQQKTEDVLPAGQLTMTLTALFMRAAGGSGEGDKKSAEDEEADKHEAENDEEDEANAGDEEKDVEPLKVIDSGVEALYSSLLEMESRLSASSSSVPPTESDAKTFQLRCKEFLSRFGHFPRPLRSRLWISLSLLGLRIPFKDCLVHRYELAKLGQRGRSDEEEKRIVDGSAKEANDRLKSNVGEVPRQKESTANNLDKMDDDDDEHELHAQLDRDLPRLHRYHPGVTKMSSPIRRVLVAWQHSTTNASDTPRKRRAYWQGMDSLAAVFMLSAGQDETFAFHLMELWTDIILPDVYVHHSQQQGQGTSGTKEQLNRIVRDLAFHDPELYVHLFQRVAIDPELFALPWIIAGFAHGVLPLSDALFNLFDWFMAHKITVVDFCLAVLVQLREVLLRLSDLGDVRLVLGRLPVSANALVMEGLRICEAKRALFPYDDDLSLVLDDGLLRRTIKWAMVPDALKGEMMLVCDRGRKQMLMGMKTISSPVSFVDSDLIRTLDKEKDGKLVVQTLLRERDAVFKRKYLAIASFAKDDPFADGMWDLIVAYSHVPMVLIVDCSSI